VQYHRFGSCHKKYNITLVTIATLIAIDLAVQRNEHRLLIVKSV